MSEHALLARSMLAAALQGSDWKLVQRAYVALGGLATGPSDMEPTPYAPPSCPHCGAVHSPFVVCGEERPRLPEQVEAAGAALLVKAGELGLLQPEAQAIYERTRAEHRALVLARYAAGASA
jgi:hypothetical protein